MLSASNRILKKKKNERVFTGGEKISRESSCNELPVRLVHTVKQAI